MMGGRGTSPKACMQMTWKACPAGRRGTGTVHMATASAHELQPLTALPCSDLCSSEAAHDLHLPWASYTNHKPTLRYRPTLGVKYTPYGVIHNDGGETNSRNEETSCRRGSSHSGACTRKMPSSPNARRMAKTTRLGDTRNAVRHATRAMQDAPIWSSMAFLKLDPTRSSTHPAITSCDRLLAGQDVIACLQHVQAYAGAPRNFWACGLCNATKMNAHTKQAARPAQRVRHCRSIVCMGCHEDA